MPSAGFAGLGRADPLAGGVLVAADRLGGRLGRARLRRRLRRVGRGERDGERDVLLVAHHAGLGREPRALHVDAVHGAVAPRLRHEGALRQRHPVELGHGAGRAEGDGELDARVLARIGRGALGGGRRRGRRLRRRPPFTKSTAPSPAASATTRSERPARTARAVARPAGGVWLMWAATRVPWLREEAPGPGLVEGALAQRARRLLGRGAALDGGDRRGIPGAGEDVDGGHGQLGRGLALEPLHLLVDDDADLLALLDEEPGHEHAHLARADAAAEAVEEGVERAAELVGRGEAIGGPVGHGAIADVGELGVGVGDHLADARLPPREPAAQHHRLALALGEALPGDRLPEHHPHAEEVGPGVHQIAAGLLGRDVGELALEHAALGVAGRARGLGDAEVDHLHLPVVGDEHVLRAHVAVDDAQLGAVEVAQRVRVGEPGEHLGEDAHVDVERHAVAPGLAEHGVERLAVEVVHRQEVVPPLDADLVGLHDVGVVEARGEARLVEEHGDEVLVPGELLPEELDDEELVHPHRPGHHREEHRRHAPLPEEGDDPVLSDAIGFHGHIGVGAIWT